MEKLETCYVTKISPQLGRGRGVELELTAVVSMVLLMLPQSEPILSSEIQLGAMIKLH